MPVSVTAPTFPARSVARPDAERSVPSTDNVTGGVTLPGATPDSASAALKVTTTALLFQRFAFGPGDAVPVTTGGVLSMFSVTLAVAVLPAWSTAVTW